jgi:hypothetical protein
LVVVVVVNDDEGGEWVNFLLLLLLVGSATVCRFGRGRHGAGAYCNNKTI